MNSSVWFALAIVAMLFFMWRMRRGDVTPGDARKMVQDGALLLDVRSVGEFAGGHLPGAKNIPVQELQSRLKELPSKERRVVVYCASGARSAMASRLLKRAGYAQVHDLGAMGRW